MPLRPLLAWRWICIFHCPRELVLATNRLSLLGDSNGGNLVILCVGRFYARVADIWLVPMLSYNGTILRKYWYLGTSPDNNLIPMSGYNGTIVFYFECLSLFWTQTVGYQAFLLSSVLTKFVIDVWLLKHTTLVHNQLHYLISSLHYFQQLTETKFNHLLKIGK